MLLFCDVLVAVAVVVVLPKPYFISGLKNQKNFSRALENRIHTKTRIMLSTICRNVPMVAAGLAPLKPSLLVSNFTLTNLGW